MAAMIHAELTHPNARPIINKTDINDLELMGPVWDEAFLRVESYLRAHQIESRLVLNRLTLEIIRAARKASEPSNLEANSVVQEPLACAMLEAEHRTAAWFKRVLGDAADPEDERLGTRGRIALVLADVPARWPQYFLSESEPPAELVQAMRAAYIEAGPEIEIIHMIPRPMDFGPIANVADETWKTFARWPILRAVLSWVLFLNLLAALWYFTH
jgi:hypothetical protein